MLKRVKEKHKKQSESLSMDLWMSHPSPTPDCSAARPEMIGISVRLINKNLFLVAITISSLVVWLQHDETESDM